MKKIIIILALAISSLSVFASDENVTKEVLRAFNKEFSGAKDVEWTRFGNYYMASFIYGDQKLNASYKLDGALVEMTRNILSLQLPMNLQTNLRKIYNKYWISDLYELSTAGGSDYYITIENADSKLYLKSEENTRWKLIGKTEKI